MHAPTLFKVKGTWAEIECLDGESPASAIPGRGAANAHVSAFNLEQLALQGIPTHFECLEKPNRLRVKWFDHGPPLMFVQYTNYEHGTKLEKPHLVWHSTLVHHPLAHQAKDHALQVNAFMEVQAQRIGLHCISSTTEWLLNEKEWVLVGTLGADDVVLGKGRKEHGTHSFERALREIKISKKRMAALNALEQYYSALARAWPQPDAKNRKGLNTALKELNAHLTL